MVTLHSQNLHNFIFGITTTLYKTLNYYYTLFVVVAVQIAKLLPPRLDYLLYLYVNFA